MGDGVFRGIFRACSAIAAAFVFAGLGVSLSGCPVAAKLENDDRFPALHPGPQDCNQPLPEDPVIGCDYKVALNHCVRGGCHNSFRASELDLTPDPLLIARILEVPSKHVISCGTERCDLTNAQCDNCRKCRPNDFLLTKTNVTDSWIIQKMAEFDVDVPSTVPDMGCGKAMPIAPGNVLPGGIPFDEERRTCLTNFFTWIANNGQKCEVSAAGSGGGGAGGASGGGAGSGGTGGT